MSYGMVTITLFMNAAPSGWIWMPCWLHEASAWSAPVPLGAEALQDRAAARQIGLRAGHGAG